MSDWVTQSFSELVNGWGSVVVSRCCEKLVDEAGDSSGTPAVERRYRATANEDSDWEDVMCPIVICEVYRTERAYPYL
jgi:hypothetical protein